MWKALPCEMKNRRGTCCVVNLDLGTFGPHSEGIMGGRFMRESRVGSGPIKTTERQNFSFQIAKAC